MTNKGFTLVVMIWLLFPPWPAQAHKVTVFAWVEGEAIHTQSKFSGGKKVRGGKIEVFDQSDHKILEGATDDQGDFSFSRPQKATTLKIVLTAGMGHSNHWLIDTGEPGAEQTAPNPSPREPQPVDEEHVHFDPRTIERIVERAVEKNLAPIKAQIADQAWGLRDIVAGVGYILGLMGLASYIHYRKTTKTNKTNT